VPRWDRFKLIGEYYVGSGPMRFIKSKWVPGARAAFEKFPAYLPRQEPAPWLTGGKRIVSDRIERVTIPDPATASSALQTGVVLPASPIDLQLKGCNAPVKNLATGFRRAGWHRSAKAIIIKT
jgi:ABC-type transport system substrate-binding protein